MNKCCFPYSLLYSRLNTFLRFFENSPKEDFQIKQIGVINKHRVKMRYFCFFVSSTVLTVARSSSSVLLGVQRRAV